MSPHYVNHALRSFAAHCPLAARFFAAFILILTNLSAAQEASVLPTLRYPAGDQDSPKPTYLYSDTRSGDIYLADASTGRIAIYDAQRRFNFEFSTRDRLSGPRHLAVDSLGRIFVLGDTREHSLAVFDYNGEFLSYLDLLDGETQVKPASFALDLDDNLLALTIEPLQGHVFTTSGEFLRSFPILADADSAERFTPSIGNMTLQGESVILPLTIQGLLAIIDLQGSLIRYCGVSGGSPGELSFPVAACLLPDGGIAILDKHRHLVQFLDRDCNYLFEIGTCGLAEGNFFHPTTMALCADGSLIVGQEYENRIHQVVFQEPPVASGP